MINKNHHKTEFTAADIRRYLNSDMPAAEMHALESAALEDPFLADAIDGYQQIAKEKNAGIESHLEALQGRLQKRIGNEKVNTRSKLFIRFGVAAIVVLLAGIGLFLYPLLNRKTQDSSRLSKTELPAADGRANDSVSLSPSLLTDSSGLAMNDQTNHARENSISGNTKAEEQTGPNFLRSRRSAKASAPKFQNSQPENTIKESKNQFKKDIAYSSVNKPGSSPVSPLPSKPEQLSKIPAATGGDKAFMGKVTGKLGKPVPGATLSLIGDEKRLDVKADSNGSFKFSSSDSIATVAVNSAGYEPVITRLSSDAKSNDIRLRDSLSPESEASVSRAIDTKKQNLQPRKSNTAMEHATPVTGWDAYQAYIKKNQKPPARYKDIHGKVVISFSINDQGEPENFQVIQSLNTALDEEAIRLIKEGPGWRISRISKSRTLITINF